MRPAVRTLLVSVVDVDRSMRSRSGSGRGRSVSSALKAAVFTPRPSASERMAAVTRAGCLASRQLLDRPSWSQDAIPC
jgi:hypothetical protein